MSTANHGLAQLTSAGNLDSIYYLPEFISSAEETKLVESILSSKAAWKEVKGRRVQDLGGKIEQGVLLQVPFPRYIKSVVERLHAEIGVFGGQPPNHVLLNAYQPGQGIYNHQDGPIYFPGVCILSLGGSGSSAVMNFRRKLPEGGFEQLPTVSVMLQPRSVLVFCDDAYQECSHGIDEIMTDTMHEGIANLELAGLQIGQVVERSSDRLSLTVRRVLKTRRNLLRL